ncbi:protein DEK-like [Macrobrachium nipponense]|uniref:protein DEK-like n=1 Tax=Macrobrachium nipponense TaxID=159736 RepID=UPI0030C7FBD3
MDTDEKKEVPKPKTEASVPEETKTPEKAVPLYDQPLEMSGKRDRKKVERFIQEEKKEELKFEGSGTPLGDIPFIEFMLKKTHQDELKVLHRVAYGRPGSGVEIKKNLRKFNGFGFTKEDKKFEGKSLSLEKVTKAEITKILKILGMEVGGSKREIVDRFMDFMLEPKDMGRKPPKIKVGKGRGRPKRDHNQSKNTSTESYSEDEGGSDEGNEDEENDEETTKKRKKTPAKKTPAKKTPAKKPSAKKSAAKTQANVAKTVSSDSDSESDDEPLAKKAKHPPSDSEIKAMVKKILDGANLEEVTMKSVCRQVYDSYPDFDLTHKKDFIKETVKSIIS